jgi:hypothetical protein
MKNNIGDFYPSRMTTHHLAHSEDKRIDNC